MKVAVLLFAFVLLPANFSESQPIKRILDKMLGREFKTDDSGAIPEKVNAVVEANNRFAFDLYHEISSEEENIFFSPYSISSALAMTLEGARGETSEEMQSVLHITETDEIRQGYAKLYNKVNSEENYDLSVANALWIQRDYRLLRDYLDVIKNYYGVMQRTSTLPGTLRAREKR